MIYRAEIDGLRSLAIIPVILYHAYLTISGVRIFSGGYLGVDIFFVISGYLITKILIDELFDQEKISITQFYERRIRRIIPNLLLVLLFTLIASTFILSPGDLTGIALQALSAIFFVSNFYFYTWGRVEYGQAESTEHALLHTWSLAVEEQFYLLFPIVLIVLFFLHKRRLFIYARYFIFVIIVSYVLAIILSDWKPVFNFYLIFSRAWELLIGSMLVLIEGCIQ
jgi:peptidoglycan/LPS O-acetylase OafA/YrhL